MRGWGPGEKRMLRKFTAKYGKRKTQKQKDHFLNNLRKVGKGVYADVIEAREKKGKIKEPKKIVATNKSVPQGGSRGSVSVREFEIEDPMRLYRCQNKYVKAYKKGNGD